MTLLGQVSEKQEEIRIPLGIHDYATGRKIQKNFQMVCKFGSYILLRGRGKRNLWKRKRNGDFERLANSSYIPLKYAKKVSVYLVLKGPITPFDFKRITKEKIKEVAQRKLRKNHHKELE